MYGPAKALDPIAEMKVLEHIRAKHWRTAKRDTIAVLLSWRAGLRVSEIAQLTWADVSDANGALGDQVRVRRETTKGKTFTRFVPMHSELRAALQALRTNACVIDQTILLNRKRGPHDATSKRLVSWRAKGREKLWPFSYDHFSDVLAEACEEHGYEDITAHTLRHTFGTRAIIKGSGIVQVQEVMGHESIQTTRRYVHVGVDQTLDVVDALV